MKIILRFIFLNCFILVAMHSLIIAREGNGNDSDNQSLIKKTTELVDDTHYLLSEQISSASDELDSFFGEERMDGDFNKSTFIFLNTKKKKCSIANSSLP